MEGVSWMSGSGLLPAGSRARRWRPSVPRPVTRFSSATRTAACRHSRTAVAVPIDKPIDCRPIEATIVRLKREYPRSGAPKIREKLRQQTNGIELPAISTVHAVLDRHGLVKRRRRRHHRPLESAHFIGDSIPGLYRRQGFNDAALPKWSSFNL